MNVMHHFGVLQVYLIEVNNCPALYRHGQILTELLPLVIEEVAQKVSLHYEIWRYYQSTSKRMPK